MASIKINQVSAGMVIVSDVKDRNGRILLRSGTEITEKHIRVLKTWGVTYVEIASPDNTTDAAPEVEVNPETLAEAMKAIDSLFQHTDREHPAIKELSALCIQRLSQQLGRSKRDQ
ncbi:conserved hypothetical protein [Gammaproteobacteria bacterium]